MDASGYASFQAGGSLDAPAIGVVDGLHRFTAETTLASLANVVPNDRTGAFEEALVEERTPDVPERIAWAPRFGGEKVTYWDHNGSGMAWESRGDRRWVWYWSPRTPLARRGVERGTLLFDGTIAGDRMDGRARVFQRNCSPASYAVVGTVARGRERVTMRGSAPRRGDDCVATGIRDDRLVFEYSGPAPPDAAPNPDIAEDGSAPPGLFEVTGVRSTLNVRLGPDAGARKIGELAAGRSGLALASCSPAIDRARWLRSDPRTRDLMLADRWCAIATGSGSGYVSGRYLREMR